VQVLGVLLMVYQGAATPTDGNEDDFGPGSSALDKPVILQLSIDTNIRFRYARTEVATRVSNAANTSQEVSFSFVIPESAYISGFQIAVDNVTYEAYVREKEVARQEYMEAVEQGRTAGHVVMNARDSQRFTVSVNVEPQKKVNFKLTYEELLNRKLGTYRHVINLDPGQIVNDLKVTTRIEESSNITTLKVPALRMSNEILEDPSETTNPLATIERPSAESAVIKFWPTQQQQQELAGEGIQGQLVIEYDVDRTSRPGEILVSDGYFVHFFAPADLQPLPKHVIFVLDTSGSMDGRKLEQLKQAMSTILTDLNQADLFSVVLFSSTVQVWDSNATDIEFSNSERRTFRFDWDDNGEEEAVTLAPTVIADATTENIEKAKEFINGLSAFGATNINAALLQALQVSQISRNNSNVQKPETIIIFLTDGEANIQPSEPRAIIRNVKRANTGSTSIFTLALGRGANFDFLKQLSLRNTGFARKIYEASDTALQLRDFYRQVASPLLANVTFRYEPDQVVRSTLTKRNFRRIFDGSEIVVCGRLKTDSLTCEVKGQSASGNSSYSFTPTLLPPGEINSTASYSERLWAYLTIQQLLDKQDGRDTGNNVKHRNYTHEALQLALRYSFVTPLTSLIVVKPNDNATSVNTEDGSVSPRSADSGGIFLTSGMTPLSIMASLPRSSSHAMRYGGSAHHIPRSRNHLHLQSASVDAYESPAVTPAASVLDLALNSAMPASLPAGPQLVNLSDALWFASDWPHIVLPTGVNGTDEWLQLATANETNVAHDACVTPGGESGHCRHLRFCVLDVFTASYGHFLPYFCRITSFVGACCPDSLQMPVN